MSRWGLGVDLGTSFSAGATAQGDRVELLEVGGERRIASTVLLTEDGRLLAGTFAQRTVGRLPDRAERNPKRYVGRAPMLLGGRPVTAVEALAALLGLFVGEARRRHDDTDPDRVVLTHPVAWTAAQRDELRAVAERVLPGVGVELLAEPVAAALHHVREDAVTARAEGGTPPSGPVAVYDLGGGTLDIAVVAVDRGSFQVLGHPGGDPDLGGEVFDQQVYRHFGEQLAHAAADWWQQVGTNPERRWLAEAADLLAEARLAKETLSEYETASQYIPGADADVHLSRAELDTLIGDDVQRSLRMLADVITGSGVGDRLGGVLLTGGASRTPLVERLVRGAYGDLVRTLPDPKTAVAFGAARHALGVTEVLSVDVGPPRGGRPPGPRPGTPPGGSPAAGGREPRDRGNGHRAPAATPRGGGDAPAPRGGRPGAPQRDPGGDERSPAARAGAGPARHPGTPAARPDSGAPHPDPARAGRGPAVGLVPDTPPGGGAAAGSGGRGGAPARAADLAPVADAVVDARIAGDAVFAWRTPEGPATGHRIARLDPRTGQVLRELRLGRLVGWAVSDQGLVLTERRDGDLYLHVVGRDLTVASTTPLPTPYRPFLLADGPLAWIVLRSPDTRLTENEAGEVGALAVQTVRLGAPGALPGAVQALGPATYWYADAGRRLLDGTAATSSAPALFGDGRSCAVVIGRPASGRDRARQTLCLIGPGGDVVAVAEQQDVGQATPWVHQVLSAGGRWLLASGTGLESLADLRHGTDRRLFLPRPAGGAVRWATAGTSVFGIAVDRVVSGPGVPATVALHGLDSGRRRELGRWPVLLGSPVGVKPDDAARVRADGEHLLLGVGDDDGSLLVRADPGGARTIAAAPGWLEPVGRAQGVLLARHLPSVPPGDGTGEPGRLVRVPG